MQPWTFEVKAEKVPVLLKMLGHGVWTKMDPDPGCSKFKTSLGANVLWTAGWFNPVLWLTKEQQFYVQRSKQSPPSPRSSWPPVIFVTSLAYFNLFAPPQKKTRDNKKTKEPSSLPRKHMVRQAEGGSGAERSSRMHFSTCPACLGAWGWPVPYCLIKHGNF